MEHLRINIPITKPLFYIDMDGVLSDFDKRFKELEAQGFKVSGVFKHLEAYKDLEPIEGAIAAWHALQEKYETYILSTPAWSNPDSWSEKRIWVEKFLGKSAHKKLILCHHKVLVVGDYLIDDRKANGVGDFKGEHIHFGTEEYPDWSSVLQRLGIIG
jgi:5'(3')-deoxyribonucleotidase